MSVVLRYSGFTTTSENHPQTEANKQRKPNQMGKTNETLEMLPMLAFCSRSTN